MSDTRETPVHPWHSADGLLEAYGDQAYHAGIRLMLMAARESPDDTATIRKIREGCARLMAMGYHEKPVGAHWWEVPG